MNDFIPGQRWISNTESELGLGTVLTTDHRTVTILYPATDDTRVYAKQTAPLTRVVFASGDEITNQNKQTVKISSVVEQDGLLIYYGINNAGEECLVIESQLDNFMQLNRPSERLFGGQIDPDKWFELRYQTFKHVNRLAHSELSGLTGCRTSLIPHQLYIAHEVANRYAPRVLLADEVGLGKTIEAGMILHQQFLSERARRILIIVPETLVHQWLVEMMRRFNLYFSIFNEERCQAIEETGNVDNPFHSEQLVLCSLEFLCKNPDRHTQSLTGEWDLLVVDEAHHLQWSPDQVSLEYTVIEKLAANINGVLLLTATPEQLGKASHFARLRLLDPDRFHDFDCFVEEEKSYEPFAHAIDQLLNKSTLDDKSYHLISNTFQEGDNRSLLDIQQDNTKSKQERENASNELIEHLLDRHGTGRILFRNTRSSVKGFPNRGVTAYPLPLPDAYSICLAQDVLGEIAVQQLLCPEMFYMKSGESTPWTHIDPRVDWLATKLKELKPNKVLVIAANASTALDLAEGLRIREGIHAAVFHEGLSIVERDRAAAYFADQEYGSQVLVCSEIGSEGRNFQFSHHLVLFDLPLNPDLLEQRIGRLDRIGQTSDIEIHAPYLINSAQDVMFHWYHEGLSAFEHTCPAGLSVFSQMEPALIEALTNPDTASDDFSTLINSSRLLYEDMIEKLHLGRDKLLEYNSCRPSIAQRLKANAEKEDAKNNPADYLGNIFDCYGVDIEDHSESCFIIRPSDHMQTSTFPGLLPDGMTITYDRATALSFEDAHFITWEHPLVTGAMDLVTTGEAGNTALSAMHSDRLRAGTVLLESVFVIESASNSELQSRRYFPPTAIRLVIDQNGNDHTKLVTHKQINESKINVDTETANRVIRDQQKVLKAMMETSEKLVIKTAQVELNKAHERGRQMLDKEISRLNALKKVNTNVRDEEITFYENHWHALEKIIESATPRLDALRVIVCV